jgi:hypothetical protein
MPSKRVAWRALSTWLLTLLMFAGGVVIYSYIYVQGRERTFTEKRLRELWLIGDRLKLRIENLGNNAIPNAVKVGQEEATQPCTKKSDSDLNVLSSDGSVVPEQAQLRATCQYIAIQPHTRLIPQFTLEKVVEYGAIPHTTTKSGILTGPSASSIASGLWAALVDEHQVRPSFRGSRNREAPAMSNFPTDRSFRMERCATQTGTEFLTEQIPSD